MAICPNKTKQIYYVLFCIYKNVILIIFFICLKNLGIAEYHAALQEWPPQFRQKFEEFEAGASLLRQTYHFNLRGPV